MPGGPCSCGNPACGGSAGKHPRSGADWQKPANLVVNVDQLYAALSRWPSSNWGLATGLISGVFAIDWDPKNAKVESIDEALRVVAELDASGTWSQRTGSGGRHWVFALPEDNVPSNSRRALPPGFDVRGGTESSGGMSGGQIVLAPSVSGVGHYAVLNGGPALLPPGGIAERVRPVAHRPPPGVPSMPVGRERAWAYIRPILEEMAGAQVGERDNVAIRTAMRLQALAHGGAFSADEVWPAWYAAAMQHPFRHNSLERKWQYADRNAGAEYIPDHYGGIGGDSILPFAVPAAETTSDGSPSGAGGGGEAGAVDPVDALIARMLTPEQLDERPNPVPLVNGVLDMATAAWLIGKSGSCKSFVALDLAVHVGLGRPWLGHDVHQGLVIYVVAEGDQGMKLRQAAWRREYGPIKDVLFLPEPVQADERRTPGAGAWTVLVEACRRLKPVLVIIDTQARVTIGLNENDNGEMSYYANQADRIKRATGACVLTVHHIGRQGNDARGASSLDGAQDAELKVERDGMQVKLVNDKQKDQAEEPPIVLRLKRSEGGADPDTGRDLSSLVIDHAAVPMLGEPTMPKVDATKHRALLIYRVLADAIEHGGEGITRAEARTGFFDLPEVKALPVETRRSSWRRSWNLLVSRGRVMRYGSSQRLGVFPPPDGAADGLLTMNTGGPDDAPPEGWSVHWPDADRPQAVDNSVDNYAE